MESPHGKKRIQFARDHFRRNIWRKITRLHARFLVDPRQTKNDPGVNECSGRSSSEDTARPLNLRAS